ncbi:ABC transporter ATP-binding protein [Rhodococcus sp. 06-1477-1B]|uniref:ABC transporter ATP-binding protein n=1 Tax=Rhodococcus sp. 06-1474-1B TaxID=2022499 RepID=UPI000B9BA355|nr:ABC transporter ATP-binding protein [Rhodococcus sp. 06-1474-1B]MBY4383134.1 ABC transporter ATP-binding protein [Rhodococcus fascians]OZD52595.1 ABC transporter ATP-binding protein [Rhodococcus sp. 06-1477-1B]MBY4397809.1 ABC transporter ATP-binding protein [Rhodococcus fascians]MBY4406561.1 ABC transporter ATP-binding protein [Rhodococcus fascians]MBY4422332.1 ABC transporter ATP-binding protein [Rhodococcus fascians]
MTDAVLTMDEVAKSFRRKTVLDGCSFAVERGSVTALVGSNGAGKSTLLSLAVGLLTPDSGTIRVLGEGVTQRGISPGLSYLAQHKPLYPHFTVAELLRFGRNTNSHWDDAYAKEIVDAAGIATSARVKSLSPGHRTRIALALALGRRPEVLLLDEPLADLDPVARRAVARTLMRDAAENGTTIVLSSHVLSELVDVADRLLLLRGGRMRLDGDLDAITADHYLLAGSSDADPSVEDGTIVSVVFGSGATTFVVQGKQPRTTPPGWTVENATLDDVVLAHLGTETT